VNASGPFDAPGVPVVSVEAVLEAGDLVVDTVVAVVPSVATVDEIGSVVRVVDDVGNDVDVVVRKVLVVLVDDVEEAARIGTTRCCWSETPMPLRSVFLSARKDTYGPKEKRDQSNEGVRGAAAR
jgi:hypothetical protein